MPALAAAAAGVVVLLLVGFVVRRMRRRESSLQRRAHALASLRELCEHPSPIEPHTHGDQNLFENVHILDTQDAADRAEVRRYAGKVRRHVAVPRPNPSEVALRPTIAELPTLSYRAHLAVAASDADTT